MRDKNSRGKCPIEKSEGHKTEFGYRDSDLEANSIRKKWDVRRITYKLYRFGTSLIKKSFAKKWVSRLDVRIQTKISKMP